MICVKSWNYVSDRVCYLDLEFPSKSGKLLCCRVINAYCPHSKLAKDKPNLIKNFYGNLKLASSVGSNVELFFLGDFNSKLGRITNDDQQYGLDKYMGSHGMGVRNDNGDLLLNFMIEKDLFATNTSFCHPSRHKTTYTGWRKDWSSGKRSKKTMPVYSQIDFILCRRRSKPLLRDARSYAGALTYSDHRIVISRVGFHNIHLCFKPKNRL